MDTKQVKFFSFTKRDAFGFIGKGTVEYGDNKFIVSGRMRGNAGAVIALTLFAWIVGFGIISSVFSTPHAKSDYTIGNTIAGALILVWLLAGPYLVSFFLSKKGQLVLEKRDVRQAEQKGKTVTYFAPGQKDKPKRGVLVLASEAEAEQVKNYLQT